MSLLTGGAVGAICSSSWRSSIRVLRQVTAAEPAPLARRERVEQVLNVRRQRDLRPRQVGLAGQRAGLGHPLPALLAEPRGGLAGLRAHARGVRVRAVVERVGAVDAGLVRAQVRVAALEGLLVRRRLRRLVAELDAVRHRRQRRAEHVRVVVQHVDAQRLPVEVVPDRLHAGEAALAGDGGRVGCRRSGLLRAHVVLDRALAVVDRLEELAQRLGERRRVDRQPPQLGDLLLALPECLRPDVAHLAERLHRRAARLGERAEAREEGVEVRRGAMEVGQQRCLLVGQLAEPRHRRAQLVEELREAAELGAELVAAGGGDLGGVARLLDPADHVALVLLELGRRRCPSW